MAKRFDATIKHLVESHPADWLALAGLPAGGELKVIDADVSTIGPAADKVIHVSTPQPYLAHLEFQSGADAELDGRMLLYNVLLRWRHKLPVRSVVVLLRPQADGAGVTGGVGEGDEPDARLDFRYRVIRAWRLPVDAVLAGGIGTLPLAPIVDVDQKDVPRVIDDIGHRLERLKTSREVADTWAATFILIGLRYPGEFGRRLLKGVRNMKESTTYQLIIEEGEAQGLAKGLAKGRVEGRVDEARSLVLRLGERRFGAPAADVVATLNGIQDLATIESIAEKIVEAKSWDDVVTGR